MKPLTKRTGCFAFTWWVIFLLVGCNSTALQSVAELETFNFRYVLLSPQGGSGNNYRVRLKIPTRANCQTVPLTETQLRNMLASKTFAYQGVIFGFTEEMLTHCNPARHVTDDNAIEALRNARQQAKINRVGGGSNPSGIDIQLGTLKITVYNAGGPLTPGPMLLSGGSVADLPASLINEIGADFSPLNLSASDRYIDFKLKAILPNPPRMTAEFSMLARQPNSDQRLLIWEGELVLKE